MNYLNFLNSQNAYIYPSLELSSSLVVSLEAGTRVEPITVAQTDTAALAKYRPGSAMICTGVPFTAVDPTGKYLSNASQITTAI